MPAPRESSKARAAKAKLDRTAAVKLARNRFYTARRRIDFAATQDAARVIEAARGNRSISATINSLLMQAGKALLTLDDSNKIDRLAALEHANGYPAAPPRDLLDALIEFQQHAGHASLSAAVDDLIARAERRLAENAAGEERKCP